MIIPVFNRPAKVQRAIASALNQTRAPLEVIVVDDGSTDETASVIESITDRRVHLIRQANKGVSAARNTGLAVAQGDFIVFLDSDDTADPKWLQTLLEVAEQEDASVVFAAISRQGSGHIESAVRSPTDGEGNPLRGVYLPGAYMVARSIFDQVGGFDEQLRYSENHELGLRIDRHCSQSGVRVGRSANVVVVMDRSESGDSNPWKLDATERILAQHAVAIRSDPKRHARWLGIAAVESARHRKSGQAARFAARALVSVPYDRRAWLRFIATLMPPLARRRWGEYPPDDGSISG